MRQLIAAALLLTVFSAHGYELDTHQRMAGAAVDRSKLQLDPSLLPRLGLRALSPGDEKQKFPNVDNIGWVIPTSTMMSIRGLVSHGAVFEDTRTPVQAVRHFYNPLNGEPLSVVPPLPDSLAPYVAASPNWSLEDIEQFGQPFSYRTARQKLYAALTTFSPVARAAAWGEMFQALGHVVHHLQDMAQPQHVRNDIHCDNATVCNDYYIENGYHPSAYETWVHNHQPDGAVLTAYPPVYVPGAGVFTTPRSFWTTTNPQGTGANGTAGKGIAEFTNRGFFSEGTTPLVYAYPLRHPNFPLPVADGPYFTPIRVVCNTAVNPCPQRLRDLISDSDNNVMGFYQTSVHDSLTETTTVNTRAVARSIFEPELVQESGRPGALVTNRFTMEAAVPYLASRATAYSAGMIDYFFRGRLEVTVPDEGTYSVIDHAIPAGNDPQTGGFTKIKLKVRNVTPGGERIPDPVNSDPNATFVAVVKFHKNICYKADLSGEYGSPGMNAGTNGNGCRTGYDTVVVSDSISVPQGINDAPQTVEFIFSGTQKIPIYATDMYLQVVYRGPLGDEPEAVIVETKDISEPTYLYNFSRWDQFTYCSTWPIVSGSCSDPMTFAEWCATGFPTLQACASAMGTTDKRRYGPADGSYVAGYNPATYSVPQDTDSDISNEFPFTPLATMVAPVGNLTRVAFLLDAQPTNKGLIVKEYIDSTHESAVFRWYTGTAVAVKNQIDESVSPPSVTPSVRYKKVRGVYMPEEFYDELSQTSLPNPDDVPNLVLVPSQINF